MPKLLIVPLLAILALTGCSAATGQPTPKPTHAKPATFLATGSLTLIGGALEIANLDSGCQGSDHYSDLVPGAQVTIADASGKTVGVGELDAGSTTSDGCALPFDVSNVPVGSKFYKVSVAHRDGVQFTAKEMRAGITLSIGG